MNLGNVNLSTFLDQILDRAADNFRIAKILMQLGLDPNNITYDAIFSRLVDIFLASITIANLCALVGAGFFVATLLTRTMVPLRVFGIISGLFFVAFGALAHDVKTFLLYLLLLPINIVRLNQMRILVKKAQNAAQGDTSMEWLKPFMTQRKYRQGDVLFKKGDAANEMFLTVAGKFLVVEIGVELPPGRLMGELGFLTPNNRRTATVKCTEVGQVLTITYEKLLELYFQNPQFGYYFLVLTSQRLLQNIARLEGIVASAPATTASATAAPARPVDSPAIEAKSATTAQQTTGPIEPGQAGSIVARETTMPDAIEIPPEGRRASAVKLVERFSLWSGVAGLIPVPLVDLAAVGGVQIQMLRRISRIYSVPFSENRGKALIVSLVGSTIPVSSGIGAASMTKSVPVIGTAISALVMPALSAGATYAIGMAFIQHFASGGTLLDFNPAQYREFINAQKELWRTRTRAAPAAASSAPASRTRSTAQSDAVFPGRLANLRKYLRLPR
jgi:CRP-like cAMP-binding protein